MENKLDELLNSLIEKGFIPFNIPEITEIKYISTKNKLRITSHQNNRDYKDDLSLRDLVSKSSGLWQYVCENGMIKGDGQYESTVWTRIYEDERDSEEYKREYGTKTAEYYLIESALCDEDKLEDFILQNVKIG